MARLEAMKGLVHFGVVVHGCRPLGISNKAPMRAKRKMSYIAPTTKRTAQYVSCPMLLASATGALVIRRSRSSRQSGFLLHSAWIRRVDQHDANYDGKATDENAVVENNVRIRPYKQQGTAEKNRRPTASKPFVWSYYLKNCTARAPDRGRVLTGRCCGRRGGASGRVFSRLDDGASLNEDGLRGAVGFGFFPHGLEVVVFGLALVPIPAVFS